MLKTCPIASGCSISASRARTTSATSAKHRDWQPLKRLIHKARQHHAVVTSLTWSGCVKQSSDDYGQCLRSVIGESKKFVDGFRARVAPTALDGGAVHHIVVFGERDFITL